METEEIIGELLIGLFLLFIAYQVGIKGDITLLHSYHYTNLDPKDKKKFTQKMGISVASAGTGVFVMPPLNLITDSELGYYIGAALVFLSVFLSIFFIIKYNGVLISFRRK